MKDSIMRMLAGILTVGFTLWNPGMPLALAALDAATLEQCRETIANDPVLNPEIREVALAEIVPKLEESVKPEAPPESVREAQIVETTAEAIHQTTEAAKEALRNPDAVTKTAVEALVKSGVSQDKVAGIETQMKQALTQAKDVLNSGGSMADAAKYFEACKNVMSEQLKGDTTVNFREAFASMGGTGGGERFRSMEVLGAAMDHGMEAAMKAHFEGSFREATMRSMGAEGGPSPEVMREMMAKATACGFDPKDIVQGAFEHYGTPGGGEFRGGPMGNPGEFHGQSPEAIAAMSSGQRAGFEAWQKGDFAAVNEMAMRGSMQAMAGASEHHDYAGNAVSREQMFKEMGAVMEQQYREVYMVDKPPVSETTAEAQAVKQEAAQTVFSSGHRACRDTETAAGEAGIHAAHGHTGCSDDVLPN